MRVMLISGWYDNGGLMNTLARAFRDHLGIDAKQLVNNVSYLGYPYDWRIGETDPDEIMDFAKDCDFFIFGDQLYNTESLPFISLLRPGNCCICGTGTMLLANIAETHRLQMASGIPVVLPFKSGEHFYNRLFVFPLDFVIIDSKRITDLTRGIKRNDEVTFCHAPTSTAKKNTDFIKTAIDLFPDVNFEFIVGKSWEDAIKAKARSHVLINSVGGRTYGLNCLEGLVMGQQVVTDLGPWTYMMYPDIPMTTVNPVSLGHNVVHDSLEDMLPGLIDAIREFKDADPACLYNDPGPGWVESHNSAEVVCERWKNFFRMMLKRGDVP